LTHFTEGSEAARYIAHLLRTSRIWFAVGVGVLLVHGLVAAWSFGEINAADHWVTHAHAVIEQTQQVQLDLRNADALATAYLLDPNPTARTGFDETVHEIPGQFAALQTMTKNNSGEQQRLAALGPMLNERETDLAAEMDLRDRSGIAVAEKLREENRLKHLESRIETACATIEAVERQLLAEREKIRHKRLIEAFAGMGLSSALILAALLIGPAEVSSTTKRLMEADRSLRSSAAELRRLTRRLITAQEDERRRIARNLHDDLSQNLAYFAMDLGRVAGTAEEPALRERLLQLKMKAGDTADLARAISRELHASTLDDLGLPAALEEQCTEFQQRTGIATKLDIRNVPDHPDSEVSMCVYFVVAESLRNIAKHAGASKATVKLEADVNELRAAIADDGAGIDEKAPREHSGIGLTIMRERLYMVGGTMSIRRVEERGTVVEIAIPRGAAGNDGGDARA
jgi:signal transduction histidine kinase